MYICKARDGSFSSSSGLVRAKDIDRLTLGCGVPSPVLDLLKAGLESERHLSLLRRSLPGVLFGVVLHPELLPCCGEAKKPET